MLVEICPKNIIENNKLIESLKDYKLNTCHTIIISDPYIFENSKDGSIATDVLKIILKDRIRANNKCLIEYSNIKFLFDEKKYEEVFKKEFPNTELKFNLKSKIQLHDRNIFTNNFTLSCDAGFINSYKKATKIIIYPTLCQYEFQRKLTDKYKSEFTQMIDY